MNRATHGVHLPRPPVRLPGWAQIETAAEMFRALGDPERLRFLVRLAAGEAVRAIGLATASAGEWPISSVSAM